MLFETSVNGSLSRSDVSLISKKNLVKKNFALTLSVIILISNLYSAIVSNLMAFLCCYYYSGTTPDNRKKIRDKLLTQQDK